MKAIEIKDLTFTYPASQTPTLNHLYLEVEQGDFLAIVGNNGCGKSTFCKCLNGLIPHFIDGDFSGEVHVGGLDTRTSDVGTLATQVGYVYQDFENQIVRPTVLDDASYACLNYAMPDYLERGRTALKMVGLSTREKDYIWQLSGGQTHLLALAGAISLRPDILILDEPIAQLDPQHADEVYEILKTLNEKYGKTIIVIEHHTEYIANYCHHVMLVKEGGVAWKLPVDEALRHVDELQESHIFPPQVTQAAKRMQQAGTLAKTAKLPTTILQGMSTFQNCRYQPSFTRPTLKPETEKPVVTFKEMCVSYRSFKGEDRVVLDHLNLTIHKGDKIALVGSNGAGKSTLMKLMVGLVKPTSGTMFLNGQDVTGQRTEQLSPYVSLVYQNPEDMFIKDSIRHDVAYAMQVRQVTDHAKRTDELLSQFSLETLADRDGRLLSGGQMRKASLAIGIALNPPILLLDEPTANLDIATRHDILRTLKAIAATTDTVMIATHDMQLVCEWASRIVVLDDGKVIADGTRDDIFGNPTLLETVGIRPPEIFSMAQALDHQALLYTVEEFTSHFKEVGS